jgi:hypothetical protein
MADCGLGLQCFYRVGSGHFVIVHLQGVAEFDGQKLPRCFRAGQGEEAINVVVRVIPGKIAL